jgi:hypothetical protein
MDTNTDKTRDMDWVPSRRLVDIIRACVCRHKSVWFVIVWRLVGSTQPVQTQNQWSLTSLIYFGRKQPDLGTMFFSSCVPDKVFSLLLILLRSIENEYRRETSNADW